jgi:hypothetical protein
MIRYVMFCYDVAWRGIFHEMNNLTERPNSSPKLPHKILYV